MASCKRARLAACDGSYVHVLLTASNLQDAAGEHGGC
jgi:hypothetical protein